MESEQEIHSTFSKLNVNAVEFVPNFGSFGPNSAEPESTIEEIAKPDVVMSENNGSGESLDEISCWSVERKICHIECRKEVIRVDDLIPSAAIFKF